MWASRVATGGTFEICAHHKSVRVTRVLTQALAITVGTFEIWDMKKSDDRMAPPRRQKPGRTPTIPVTVHIYKRPGLGVTL